MAFDILTTLMHRNSIIHLNVYSFYRGKKVKRLRKLLKIFSLKNRERIIRLFIKTGILHGGVHEVYDALSTQINHEMDESSLKQLFTMNYLFFINTHQNGLKKAKIFS